MLKKIFQLFLLLFLIAGCGVRPQQKLIGSWIVDYSETFKTIKNSEIWNELEELEKEMFPDLLEEMISTMRITIYSGELITEIGNNIVNVPYRIESAAGDKIITSANIEGEEVRLTFTILSDNLMMFSSDATNDMDFYVWKREAVRKV